MLNLEDVLLRRHFNPARSKGVHPSQVTSPLNCVRRSKYREQFPNIEDEPKDALVGLGEYLHRMVRNRYLGPAGILRGKWNCYLCHSQYEGFLPDHECFSKYETGFEYDFEEYSISIPELDVVGHYDGIIIVNGEERILEIKSTGQRAMHYQMPKEYHVDQLTVYMKGSGILKGTIIYLPREDLDGYKIEHVEFEEDRYTRIVGMIKEYQYQHSMEVPDRNVLCKPNSYLRKNCPFVNQCYGAT